LKRDDNGGAAQVVDRRRGSVARPLTAAAAAPLARRSP
jgi:hypothetical protein